MDDIEIIINNKIIETNLAFSASMIQNINEIYIKKRLEVKFLNKIETNIYIKSIENINYSNDIYMHPNDNYYIVKVNYSIIGIKFFKDMKLAFTNENIIKVNDNYYFKKNNIIALVKGIIINDKNEINEKLNIIIIVKVLIDPEFITNQDGNIEIGLNCSFISMVDKTDENIQKYNVIL